jgi:phage tail sheath protein FI
MPTYIAPGVYSEEVDLSLYTPQLSTSILGLVGCFKKGPVNRITFISNRSQFEQIFGTPLRGDLGHAAHAALYFLRWGSQLKVVRVGDANIARSKVEIFDNNAVSIGFIRGVTEGEWADGIQVVITAHLVPSENDPSTSETVYNVQIYAATDGVVDSTGNTRFDGFKPLETFEHVVFDNTADTRYVEKIVNGVSQYIIFDFTEELIPALLGPSTPRTGTISSSGINVTGTGTFFTTELRVGDTITANSETRTVTSITTNTALTVNTAFTSPLSGASFTAATTKVNVLADGNDGTASVQASDIIGHAITVIDPETNYHVTTLTGIRAFEDPLVEDINLLSAPGFNHVREVADFLITTAQTRFDCLAVLDTPDLRNAQDIKDYVEGELGTVGNLWSSFAPLASSNRAAIFGPWIKIFDSYNNEEIFVPPSVRTLGVFAYNDNVSYPWYAAAGPNRGLLFNTLDVRFRLSLGDVEEIYGFGVNVNPVQVTVDGILINGNKTLQRKPSLLQNIHVVRMLMYAEKVIATATRYLQWEPHDPITWRRYINLVEPFLQDIVSKRGITEFRIKCDSETNTALYINQGTMVAELHIIPTNAVAVIVNRYVIHPHGAQLESSTAGQAQTLP